jgi:hypothetical protein
MSTRPFHDEHTNIYWLLKGRPNQGVPEHPVVGQTFTPEKTALFNYPVGQVLLVCNDDFETVAYAKVLAFEHEADKASTELTRVHCQIVKTLTSEEQESLTHYLQTTRELMKETS